MAISGQPAGIRLTAAERHEPVLGEPGDVAESLGDVAALCKEQRVAAAVAERRRPIHRDGHDGQDHADIELVRHAHPGGDDDGFAM